MRNKSVKNFTKHLQLAGAFLVIVLFSFACNKEVEVTPGNIYGSWTHFYQPDNYFEGIRFKENGDFYFVERFGYEKDLKEKSTPGYRFTYTLAERTVTIYRHDVNDNSNTVLRTFKIKKLTAARLVEEDDNYTWKREE